MIISFSPTVTDPFAPVTRSRFSAKIVRFNLKYGEQHETLKS